jgi:predicted  nucleic acid-binding Zn-ribbon protein
MKINFNKEHKDKLLYYINEYQNINNEYKTHNDKIKSLQEELNSLTEKLNVTESNLQSIREEEKKYMDELHTIYGDFTLNDLYESIYLNM